MGKVYSNQTLLTLRFDTKLDLSNISTASVKYDGPGGTGSWTGTIEAPATSGIVTYSYNGTLPAGKYKVWVLLTDTGGKVIPSEVDYLTLHTEGT